jgi:hypothetical protein
MRSSLTRREFLLGLPWWFPFFWRHPRFETLAGIRFEVLRRGRANVRYLLIHGNEETARQVLAAHLRTNPGIAHLVTNHTRNVPVPGGVIDPNRMFSRAGAETSLRRLNPAWSNEQRAAALDRLDRVRGKLVNTLTPPPGGLTFALHNNSEAYSVNDEVPISDASALNDRGNPHEFFLATAMEDYAVLAHSPYNVVLQSRKPADDDGSLSRLAARRGIRYVNLEVALGKAARQKEMLEWAAARLTAGPLT